ncbi:MAG: hypothetical protein WAN11_04755 [Syntrophobacteraceae bacterium]
MKERAGSGERGAKDYPLPASCYSPGGKQQLMVKGDITIRIPNSNQAK